MPDITMCPGGECPMRARCYRFRAVPDPMQSYLMNPPFEGERCGYFWDIAALDPTEAAIRDRAYFKWVAAGRPAGEEQAHWLAAKAELERARDESLSPIPVED